MIYTFVKSRRAQNKDDYETWIQGGVVPTLNVFDNNGDVRATVLILDGTRVDDVRVTESETMQTVISRWGTGGGNVPYIAKAYSVREDATANNFSATEIEQARSLSALQPSVQSHHAQTFIAEPMIVRRLTPVECERLQGFPDNWTASQSDSQRYKQMGNAVTVNVIEWIGKQIMENSNG